MKIFASGETVWPTAGPKAAQSDLPFAEFYRSALMSRFARSRKKYETIMFTFLVFMIT